MEEETMIWKSPVFLALLFFGSLLLAACATPVAPSGGPPDRTPPEIERTQPANGTTRFQGREFTFHFSKFIQRNSFQQAIQVEPDLGIPFEVRLGRRSATLVFSRDLPENTTVILRLGRELRDTRNNALGSPYTLAVSTGDEIDEGVIQARFFSAATGERLDGQTLFLYREPFDPESRANYVAQSDTSGRVRLSYLAEDTYRAIWVEDLNRNRRWDRDRERAQPFREEVIELGKGEEVDLGRLYLRERPDTTAPRIEGVGLLTSRHLRLRANEELEWDRDARIVVTDTLGSEQMRAYPLYQLPEDAAVMMAQSEASFSEDRYYQLRFEGFRDLAGNSLTATTDPFQGSSEPDTIRARIIGDNHLPGLLPHEPLIVGYNRWVEDSDITDSLKVVAGEDLIENWPHYRVDRHRLIIEPDEEWSSGRAWQFLVWNPDTERLRPIEPVIWHRRQLGQLMLEMAEPWHERPVTMRLESHDGTIRKDTTWTASLELRDLPPMRYRITLFEDENGDGVWNAGRVLPHEPPEPYRIYPDVPVQEGFDSEMTLTLDRTEAVVPVQDVAEGEERAPIPSGESSETEEDGVPDESGVVPDEVQIPENSEELPGEPSGEQAP